jgi:hypothetical protein
VLEELRRWHRLQPALGSLALSVEKTLAPCGVQHSKNFFKKFTHVREQYERSASSELDISAEHMALGRFGKLRLKALLRYREGERRKILQDDGLEGDAGDAGDEDYVPSAASASGGSASGIKKKERVQAKGGWSRAGAKKVSAVIALTGRTGLEALKKVAAKMTTAAEFSIELDKYCDTIGRPHYVPAGDPMVMMAGNPLSMHKLFNRIVARAKSQRKPPGQFDYADWGTVVKVLDVPSSVPDRVRRDAAAAAPCCCCSLLLLLLPAAAAAAPYYCCCCNYAQ